MTTTIIIFLVLAFVIGFGMRLCYIEGYINGADDLKKSIDEALKKRLEELKQQKTITNE